MGREVILVPNGEALADKIPEILEKTRNEKTNIYLDKKLSKQLGENRDLTDVICVGKYNMYLGEECDGFIKVLLIRIRAIGKYVYPNISEKEIFLVLA